MGYATAEVDWAVLTWDEVEGLDEVYDDDDDEDDEDAPSPADRWIQSYHWGLPDVDIHTLGLDEQWIYLIRHGLPQGYRSDAIWLVTRALIQAGLEDEQIMSILLDPNNRIGEKLRERQDPYGAAQAEVERIRAKVEGRAPRGSTTSSRPAHRPRREPVQDEDILRVLTWMRDTGHPQVRARDLVTYHLVRTAVEARDLLSRMAAQGLGELTEERGARGPAAKVFRLARGVRR